MWRAMETKATSVAFMLAEAQETRRQWEALTDPTRRVAVAADLETAAPLSRQGDHPLEVGRASERPCRRAGLGVLAAQRGLGAGHPRRCGSPGRTRSSVQGRESACPAHLGRARARGQQALGLTPDTVHEDIPGQVQRIHETARQIQAKIDDFASTREPAEEPDATDLGPAWNIQAACQRDAILQPPKHDIVPASKILERSHERQADLEPELE